MPLRLIKLSKPYVLEKSWPASVRITGFYPTNHDQAILKYQILEEVVEHLHRWDQSGRHGGHGTARREDNPVEIIHAQPSLKLSRNIRSFPIGPPSCAQCCPQRGSEILPRTSLLGRTKGAGPSPRPPMPLNRPIAGRVVSLRSGLTKSGYCPTPPYPDMDGEQMEAVHGG